MASPLFDPLLELALDVAKKGRKAKPRVAPPSRLEPMLKFTKLPERAKDTVLETLDSDDDFRGRVAAAATEAKVGRIGMSYLERPDGWDTFVNQMLEAADEPIIATGGDAKKLARQLDVAQRAQQRAESEADELRGRVEELERSTTEHSKHIDALTDERDELAAANTELGEQRQRAVSELKRTEEIMARHIAERKRLEALVETMTAAQLSTTAVGGGVTDVEVRVAIDALETSMADIQGQLDSLRRAATPEQVPTARRTPLPVPHGMFDDSVEYAEYLLGIPNMTVLVDGYNVTKTEHGDWDLEQQRAWLEQQLCGLLGIVSATFGVVFDGADVVAPGTSSEPRVRVRFSPAGVEADDVIIDSVAAIDQRRPVTVVSSDNRVRTGATKGGANVLHSAQLLSLLA